MRTKDHSLVGIASDLNSIDEIVSDLLDEKKTDESFDPKVATYVNQWMYQSNDGILIPLEFWYNNGKLKGHTLWNQLERSIELCEMSNRRD